MRTVAITAAAFVMAFLLFGGVMLLPLLVSDEPTPQATAGEQGQQGFLWVVVHDEGRLTALLQLVADTEQPSLRVVGYPPECEVVYGVEVTTAAALYEQHGAQVATMIRPGEVLELSVSGVSALMGRLSGNLPLTLRQDVAGLTAGTYSVTPLQAAAILRFAEWEDGGVGAARIHAQLAAMFLNRVLTEGRDTEAAFRVLTDCCDTRLRISQFAAAEELLEALCRLNDGTLCTADVVPGAMVGTGERLRYVCD